MKALVLSALALLVAGCEYHRPGMTSAEIQAFAAEHPGITAQCLGDIRWGRRNWASGANDPECFETLPAQHWSGLWNHGWEWSDFCPDPAKTCPGLSEGEIVLSGAKRVRSQLWVPWGLYHVEFVGRRTKVPGSFGNQLGHLVVVDRVIAIRQIPSEKYTEMPPQY